MGEFKMPSLGADMDAGTLIDWRVKPGDSVNRGDVIADVETDKGIVEVEVWETGVVESLAVAAGTKVPVGTVLALLTAKGAPANPEPSAPLPSAPPISAARPAAAQAPSVAPAAPKPPPARPMASPAARQLARELSIDLAGIVGTGPHGAVTRADVELSAKRPASPSDLAAPSGPRPSGIDATAMRRAIGAAMSRSKREIPHYYLSADLDVGAASHFLEAFNASRSAAERVLFATLLLKATALAAREIPEVNGFFLEGEFRPAPAVHLGVAISQRQGGLIAPAIHGVDTMTLSDLQTSLRDLVARVRSGRLRSSEMSDPTLTVTNLGDQGVQSVFGVIYPPQVALVGFGKVTDRPWAESGMLGVRPVVTATLAADHRVSDGHRGALFLATIGRLLSKPEDL